MLKSIDLLKGGKGEKKEGERERRGRKRGTGGKGRSETCDEYDGEGIKEEEVTRGPDLTWTEPLGRASRQDGSEMAFWGFSGKLINLCAS